MEASHSNTEATQGSSFERPNLICLSSSRSFWYNCLFQAFLHFRRCLFIPPLTKLLSSISRFPFISCTTCNFPTWLALTLNIEAVCFSETLLFTYQTRRCHNPGGHNMYLHRHKTSDVIHCKQILYVINEQIIE